MIFYVPSVNDVDTASRRPTVAIDIGFGNSSTSGIAWSEAPSQSPELFTTDFGSCPDKVLSCVKGHGEFNLILEAPLFGAFDNSGNPVGRLPLEKRSEAIRYWYLQAGANVGLGALFLLRELATRAEGREIHLFEGFVSFKSDVSDHKTDAKLLLSELRKGHDGDIRNLAYTAQERGAERCISILEMLGFNGKKHSLSCPLVVVPHIKTR